MKPIAVITTTATLEEARTIARALIERKLGACAQLSEIESTYSWDGAVQTEKEYRLLLKTTKEKYGAVERAIRELHSYELPAIYSLLMDDAYAPYARWVEENSSGG